MSAVRPFALTLSAVLTCRRCRAHLRAGILLGFPCLELLEQRFPFGVGRQLPGGRSSASGSRRTGCAPRARSCARRAIVLAAGKRCQSGKRRRQRHFLPFRMERRILEGREFREERCPRTARACDSARCWAPSYRPPAPPAPRWCRPVASVRNQVGIVLRGQARRQIVALQRLGIVDRNEMQPVILDLADGPGRLALNRNHGIDLAGLQFLQRDALLDINELRLESRAARTRSRP